jgi:cyclopropane-fatty-acyl-phospholipid synthase
MLDESLTDGTICFRIGIEEFIVGRKRERVGEGRIVVRVFHERFFSAALCYGNLGLAEAFMNGDFELEEGSLHDFLTILLRNRLQQKLGKNPRILIRIAAYRLVNAIAGKQKNVQRHYDIGYDVFKTFLDARLVYSCGYANTPRDELEQLQANKLDRICRKLRLKSGDHILDIGCGFGGLLTFAATHYGVTGTGITISRDHYERGNELLARDGVSDRVQIEFRDHRSVEGQFDKVVSVGMLEHVPRSEYGHYFKNLARVLKPDGIGLVHAVGCNSFRNEHDPFIQKYIFPASNQPRLSEIAGFLERYGLAILDVENIIRHYYPTALSWLRRFQTNKEKLDIQKYDTGFRRMWEYYLSCAIAAAVASDAAVYQVLFAKDYGTHIPLQRV